MTLSHRARTTRVLAGAGFAAVVAGTALTPAAQAATFTKADPSADVVSYDISDPGNEEPVGVPAPNKTNGDIVTIKSVHSANNVAVKVSFRGLAKSSDQFATFFKIVTDEGLERDMYLNAGPGNRAGSADLENANGTKQKCTTSHTVDYTANTVTMSVPRKCLSYPSWVKLGFQDATISEAGTLYLDDARQTGIASLDDDPVLGGKTNRG